MSRDRDSEEAADAMMQKGWDQRQQEQDADPTTALRARLTTTEAGAAALREALKGLLHNAFELRSMAINTPRIEDAVGRADDVLRASNAGSALLVEVEKLRAAAQHIAKHVHSDSVYTPRACAECGRLVDFALKPTK